MDLGIKGKVALVAAGSQGLGKASALSLAREGARVVICARTEETLLEAKSEIEAEIGTGTGGEVLALPADVTDEAAITALVETVQRELGPVAILVNNAGGPPPGHFDDLTDADWERTFELTLMSAVRLTRAVLPDMRAAKWGRVVNISSNCVRQPIDPLFLSNSMRLAVLGWAKSLANEVAQDGILVNTVCPGWTRTERVTNLIATRARSENRPEAEIEAEITATIPLGRIGKPEELGDTVAFLASERAGYISGTTVVVDGGTVKAP